jgi:hypothetical protein
MVDQTRFVYEQGTPIVWGEAGASGVTATLSFDALPAGSARMGAKVDLGSQWDQDHAVYFWVESGTAPTAGAAVDAYLAYSHDNSNFPGGVSGSDGAWPADGNEDEWSKQLGRPAISVISTNDGNTVQRQGPVIVRPKSRYVAPVVDVNWDQAIRDQTTATDNASRLIMVPLLSKGIDP